MKRDLVSETASFRYELELLAEERLARHVPGRPELVELLRTYLNEVPVALDVLAPVVGETGQRVLEVGSGIGAVAICLAEVGVEVVGVEPGGPGFEDLLQVQRVLLEAAVELRPLGAVSPVILDLRVEELDPAVHGRFEVVFSVNVLEHVDDPTIALDQMQKMLTESGVQRHVCPNYSFPYEPHFFIPLFPFAPALTRVLLPRTVTDSGLWRSLNFVTAGQVRRWAARSAAVVTFDDGVLADAFDRYSSDRIFATRHAGLGLLVRTFERLGLKPALRALPAGLVSPMRFTVRQRTPADAR